MDTLVQALAVLGLLHTSLASPFPEGGTCGDPFTKCPEPTYEDISSTKRKLEPQVMTGTRLKGCAGGCELGTEDSWSVTVSVEVGASLGLDYQAASAGIGVSVGYSETEGQAYSQTIGCPQDAWCMLMVTDHVVEVKGNKVWKNRAGCSCDEKTEPYSILLPQTVDSASGTSAVISYEGCFLRKPPKPVKGFPYRNCPGGEEDVKELKTALGEIPLRVLPEPEEAKRKDPKDKKEKDHQGNKDKKKDKGGDRDKDKKEKNPR